MSVKGAWAQKRENWVQKLQIDPDYECHWKKGIVPNRPFEGLPADRVYSVEVHARLQIYLEELLQNGYVSQVDDPLANREGAGSFVGFLHMVLKELEPDSVEQSGGTTTKRARAEDVPIVKKYKERACLDPTKSTNALLDGEGVVLPSVLSIRQTILDLQKRHPGKKIFLAKIDLSKGYWQMLCKGNSKHRFVFDGILYQWEVMPFGPTDVPLAFQRRTNKVAYWLQAQLRAQTKNSQICVCVYLDDFCLCATEDALVDLGKVKTMLKDTFGLVINQEKSSVAWEQRCEMLGIIFDTARQLLVLPERRLKKLKTKLEAISARGGSASTREIAGLLGQFSSAALAFPVVALCIRSCFVSFCEGLRRLGQAEIPSGWQLWRPADIERYHWVDGTLTLSVSDLEVLDAAKNLIQHADCALSLQEGAKTTIILKVDAGEVQAGFVAKSHKGELKQVLNLPFSSLVDLDNQSASTKREARAMIDAVKMCHQQWNLSGWHVLVKVDSQNLAHRWDLGTADLEVNQWLFDFALWLKNEKIQCSVQWLPRAWNTEADRLSKVGTISQAVVETKQEDFNKFVEKLRQRKLPLPNLDWFADHKNHKLNRYCFLSGGEDSAFGWPLQAEDVPFVFPPLNLYRKAIRAWRESESQVMYLVVPKRKEERWAFLLSLGVVVWPDMKVEKAPSANWSFDIVSVRK